MAHYFVGNFFGAPGGSAVGSSRGYTKWDPDDTNTLIRLYKQCPELYKLKSANVDKSDYYEVIVHKLNVSANTNFTKDDVIRKIAALRKKLILERKKDEVGIKSTSAPYSKLQFLVPYVIELNTHNTPKELKAKDRENTEYINTSLALIEKDLQKIKSLKFPRQERIIRQIRNLLDKELGD